MTQTRSWFTRDFRRGLVLSCLVHAGLLATLSVVFFRGMRTRPEVAIEGFFGNGHDITELDVPGDSGLDELSAARAVPVEFVDLAATATAHPDLLGSSKRMFGALGAEGADGTGSGTGGSGGGGMMGHIPVPSTAVTRGSFTVWTDPEDPDPGQKYDIVIQVKLPRSLQTYRPRDLTGTVRGTDSYFKAIKFDANERRSVKEGVVQVRVSIPGAAVRVRDTIKIHSTVLKEDQTIEIVF